MLDADTTPKGNDWIVVPNWTRFQHYRNRNPLWIKVYAKLLHDPSYLQLSLAAKGLLQVIWLAYSQTSGQLRVCDVGRLAGARGGLGLQLVSLNHAGFIGFSASKPLATKTEVEVEVETPDPLTDEDAQRLLEVRAFNFAADMARKGTSEEFDVGIQALQDELHVTLRESVRDQLWDIAFKPRSNR